MLSILIMGAIVLLVGVTYAGAYYAYDKILNLHDNYWEKKLLTGLSRAEREEQEELLRAEAEREVEDFMNSL